MQLGGSSFVVLHLLLSICHMLVSMLRCFATVGLLVLLVSHLHQVHLVHVPIQKTAMTAKIYTQRLGGGVARTSDRPLTTQGGWAYFGDDDAWQSTWVSFKK